MTIDNAAWVVITNSNICKIFEYKKKGAELKLINEINHPENKLKDTELTSDKPGRYKASNAAGGAYTQPSDPKEIKIDSFTRDIAKELDHGRNANAYNNLIIIALPHVSGLLTQHLNKHVKELVTHTIEKDVINLSNQDLLKFLKEHAQYSQ
jgi:protein required for attachment to host cells